MKTEGEEEVVRKLEKMEIIIVVVVVVVFVVVVVVGCWGRTPFPLRRVDLGEDVLGLSSDESRPPVVGELPQGFPAVGKPAARRKVAYAEPVRAPRPRAPSSRA